MCFFPCDSFQNFLLPLNRVSVLKADISEILCFYMTYTNFMLILLKSIIFVALFIKNTELLASSPRINAKISIFIVFTSIPCPVFHALSFKEIYIHLFSRRRVNRENIMIKLEKLRADLKLKQFLQDTDDVSSVVVFR